MLKLSRNQILAFRREASGLNERRPQSADSLENAAYAGLQDSMPRAALLSIHARVSGTEPDTWQAPPLVQVWGPRYSAYVVAADDRAVFTLGRLSDEPKSLGRATEMASRLEGALGDERMDVRDAARIAGVHPNSLRYAAPTGRFLIYWDGAKQPFIWNVGRPSMDRTEARQELARRYFRIFGAGTLESFASWAGMRPANAFESVDSISGELLAVGTPTGDAHILAADEDAIRSAEGVAATRLLPSGDTYYLLQGTDRDLLVADQERRDLLWTSRVWPGAILHRGEIVGTWRRSKDLVTLSPWQPLDEESKEAIAAEAEYLPIPAVALPLKLRWEDR